MKKFLLSFMSVAVSLSVAAIDRSDVLVAPASVSANNPMSHAVEKKTDVKGVVPMVKSVMKSNMKLAKAGVLSKQGSVRPLAGVTAGYVAPTMFYWGFTEDFYWQSADGQTGLTTYTGPAYTPLTWANYSSGATQYSWTYANPSPTSEDDVTLTSTDQNLTVSYGFGQYDVPTLTASDGTNTDEYSYGNFMQMGGSGYVYSEMLYQAGYLQTEPKDFGSAMFDYGAPYYSDSYFSAMMNADEMLGNGLREYLEQSYPNVDYESYGVIFYKPDATYSISKMWLRAYAQKMPAGTEIIADIYALEEDGEYLYIPAEPTAHARFEAQTDMSSSTELRSLVFNVYYEDPVTGLEVEGMPLNVSSAIMITFPVPTDDSYVYYPFFSTIPEEYLDYVAAPNVSGFSYDGEDGERHMAYLPFPWTLSDGASSFGMETYELMTDATFGWFFPAEGAPVSDNVVSAPTNGGTVTIPFESLWIAENTTVAQDADGNGNISDWATYTLTNNNTNGTVDLAVTVDPLPSGESGRYCRCTLNPTSSDPVELVITQGAAGVSAVEAASAAKVAVVGGDFVVTAPEVINAVTVYNVAGQAVAASEVAGTTTVSGQSLAKGVYILRFNDGSSVKVVK